MDTTHATHFGPRHHSSSSTTIAAQREINDKETVATTVLDDTPHDQLKITWVVELTRATSATKCFILKTMPLIPLIKI